MIDDCLMQINGKAVPALDGATFKSFEPATREHLADIPRAGEADVDAAVQAARDAFDHGPWPRMSPAERSAILLAVAGRLEEQAALFAELEVRDNGTTIRKALGADLPGAQAAFSWSAHWASGLAERHPRHPDLDLDSTQYLRWRPRGVIAIVSPWNLPLLLAAWRIAPAIAAGNTCVLKPASFTSITALKLAQLMHECGLPPGVVNVVTGPGGVTGDSLVRSPGVDLIAFTGSNEVGETVQRQASSAGTSARLELGGKSPNLVLSDADLDRAVAGVAWGIFLHNGQICMAGSRAVVHRSLHAEFVERLLAQVARLRIGDPLDPATELGPLVSRQQARSARRFTELGVAEGAVLRCGGSMPAESALPDHLDPAAYFLPTVLDEVDADHQIAQQEIFGPVLAVIEAADDDDAIRIANSSRYALSAGVWSQDAERARAVAEQLRASQVWLNDYRVVDLDLPNAAAPDQAGWQRLSNELDGYREVQAITGGSAATAAGRLSPTPYRLLGL